MIDVLFITPNNNNGIYQELSNKYSAIETPTWSLLLAQSCRSQNYKVGILEKFGYRAVHNIKQMLSVKIKRKLYN